MPEAGVQQVQHGVLDASDVQVDTTNPSLGVGHPVLLDIWVDQPVLVGGVQVSQVVPAAACPLRHRVELANEVSFAASVAQVVAGSHPFLGATQRRFGVGVLIQRSGRPVDELGELDRQLVGGNPDREADLVVDDREGFAPVALTREQPVAQLVRGGAGAAPLGLEPVVDPVLGVVDQQPVEEVAVDRGALPHIRLAVEVGGWLDRADDLDAVQRGEVPVALVLAGDAHDGAGSVAHQHVVGDENRDVLSVHRDGAVHPEIDAGLRLVLLTLEIGHLCGLTPICIDRFARGRRAACPLIRRALWPRVSDQLVHQRVLGGQHHGGGSEQRVWPGGEHLDQLARARGNDEGDVRSFGSADPVALHRLDRVGPVEQVEVGQQTVGVRCDAHHPLLHRTPEHRVVAPLGPSVSGDLLVGEHRAQRRAPVDGGLTQIREAVVFEFGTARGLVHLCPDAGRRGSGPCCELVFELADGPGALGLGVVPAVEDLQEDPLGPAVVADVCRRDRAPVVMTQAEPPELTAHVGDVVLGVDPRMLTGLAGMFLRWKTERVVSHGVEHVVTCHPLVASEHVRADVAERMADVQTRPGGVREHVHDEQLRLVLDSLGILGQETRRVGGVIGPALGPPRLPFRLDLFCEIGVVAVRGNVVGV